MSTMELMWLALGLSFGLFVVEHFTSLELRKQLIRERLYIEGLKIVGDEAQKQLEQEKNKNHELSLEVGSLKRENTPKS